MGRNFSILLLLALLTACSSNVQQPHTVYDVHASFSTPPSRDGEDHMDDPAIYVNDKDPLKSFVIGTNKSRVGGGLHLYDFWVHEMTVKYIDIQPEDPTRYWERNRFCSRRTYE